MTPVPPVAPKSDRRGMPAWGWWLIGLGSVLAAGVFTLAAWGFSIAVDLFEIDAMAAMQEDATITAQLGTLEQADIEYLRTGMLPDANEFALRVKGSRASGMVEAEFITTLAGERLGRGTLELDDGRRFKLPTRQK
jgi:hypothetical protein